MCIIQSDDGLEAASWWNVRFGSKADISEIAEDVRFTPKSGR
jgi:hypothetical protein